MKNIIHRGITSKNIKENSYLAIKKAIKDKESIGVEFDIRLTKDKKIVLSHNSLINLNVIEEANAYQLLLHKFNLKQEEVAQKVGKSRSHIANFVRLLNLAKEVQCLLQDNKLNMGQAKPLLAIEDEKLQVKLANLIIERELSARKAEALVKKVLAGDNVIEQIEQVKEAKMYLNDVQERLKQILGTNVNIKQGKKKSRIEIEFYNDDDLARLVELLMEKQESPQMNKSRIIKDFNI